MAFPHKALPLLAALLASAAAPALAQPAQAQTARAQTAQAQAARPWTNAALDPDRRADLVVRAMTEDEKLTLVTGWFGADQPWNGFRADPLSRKQSAGFVPGLPRLGITPQWQTDAGSGVATQGTAAPELERTALPSGIASAATWNPQLAEQGGAMIGAEARASGFNVHLAGGVDLLREPRNGRNFEYAGEDPLLAGTMVGHFVRGIQSNHIVSTVKHYAFNDQETGRGILNVEVDPTAARMSDLLAFQIAVEIGQPGSVMCAYNRVNGPFSCGSDWLLNGVLKRDWGFRGYVMSDWGAQHSTLDAVNGLDQETGVTKAAGAVFGAKLKAAIAAGQVPQARLDDMCRRILRSLFAAGALDNPPTAGGPIDFAAHEAVSEADAEEGMVLLKNAGAILPLKRGQRVVVIGAHADAGVLSGGGSAQVYARGGNAVQGVGPKTWPGPWVYYKNAPLAAIAARAGAQVTYVSGEDPRAAAEAARKADVAVVFGEQWTAESQDFSLNLPHDQDALISAVAAANPKTVVVLETGGPVLAPWLDRVAGVVEAWYPGSRGGEAIGRVLYGEVNPSGRLPATFPASVDQLPRPTLDGVGAPRGQSFNVDYRIEGAAVGYKWFDKKGLKPLFPFGYGLSYTSFRRELLGARVDGGALKVRLRITNTGRAAGKDVGEVYVAAPAEAGWEAPKRLGGFAKLSLAPGQSGEAEVTVDPRVLASWDETRHDWRIAAGQYRVILAADATDPGPSQTVSLPEARLPAGAGVR